MKTISKARAEKIARNINAMDMNYQYTSDHKVWKFWNGLKSKLFTILTSLTNEEKEYVKSLCDLDKAKYFGLV
jgi:hypothetical protein